VLTAASAGFHVIGRSISHNCNLAVAPAFWWVAAISVARSWHCAPVLSITFHFRSTRSSAVTSGQPSLCCRASLNMATSSPPTLFGQPAPTGRASRLACRAMGRAEDDLPWIRADPVQQRPSCHHRDRLLVRGSLRDLLCSHALGPAHPRGGQRTLRWRRHGCINVNHAATPTSPRRSRRIGRGVLTLRVRAATSRPLMTNGRVFSALRGDDFWQVARPFGAWGAALYSA